MAKYIKRLGARLAREKLRESNLWVVTKQTILETDEGNLELEKGDAVEVGASEEGDVVVKGNAKAVIVIKDEDLARQLADVLASSDELSDTMFVKEPAADAVIDGEDVEEIIDDLTDDENSDEVEVSKVEVDKKESVENKFAKFAKHLIKDNGFLCESMLIDEDDTDPIPMSALKTDPVAKQTVNNYEDFVKAVSEMLGSIQPGEIEIALSSDGKIIGEYDKATDSGIVYPENKFDSIEDMHAFDSEPASMLEPMDFGGLDGEKLGEVESALATYEESTKSGKDYMALVESLTTKAGLDESKVAMIVNSFEDRSLKENAIAIFDHTLGKNVIRLTETVAANQWIADTGAESRFSKRYLA